MRNGLLALLLIGVVSSTGWAGLDAELRVPYRWRVVVQFVPNALLHASFQNQIVRQIQADLQPAIGELGKVEVFDLAKMTEPQRDPLTKDFLETGWPALDSPKFRELTGVKTHFVRIAVVNGTIYKLEAKQHDGSSGLVTPIVRTKETRDPQTISRLIGLLVGKDFGLVGTVTVPEKETDVLKVRFQGSAITGIERHVKVGDILAMSVIREQRRPEPPALNLKQPRKLPPPPPQGPMLIAAPQQYTLLRVESDVADGSCRCRVFTGYKTPFPIDRTTVGYRCMKLATVESPVQVRIVDPSGKTPVASTVLQVRASDVDFLNRPEPRDSLEFRDGLFRSGRPLRNIACVVITVGSNARQFPMPVMSDTPLTVRLTVDPKDAARAEFARQCEDLRNRVLDVLQSQNTLVKDLGKLIITGKNPEALSRAVNGLKALDEQDKILTEELARLKTQPDASDANAAESIARSTAQLQAVKDARPGIEEKAKELQKSINTLDDPSRFEKDFRIKEIRSQIKTLVGQGDIPAALSEYDRLYDVTKKDIDKEQKAKLEAEWQTKTDAHRKARDYLLVTWRTVSNLTEFTNNLDLLRDAVKVMTTLDDRLGLYNLLAALNESYGKLKDILDRLDPKAESDQPSLKELQTITEALRKIEDDTRAKLKDIAGEK